MTAILLTLARDGVHTERIEAAGWGIDNIVRARVECLIRPSGWRTDVVSQTIAERCGLEGNDVRCVLRLIGGKSNDLWTGLAATATTVMLHGARVQGEALARVRSEYGMNPAWHRPGVRIIDTCHLAAVALGHTRPLPLEDATEAIVGRRIGGLDGLIALINTPRIGESLRRTA